MPNNNISITEDKILDALKTVNINGNIIDLVAAGYVSGVVIKDGNVGFSLEVAAENVEASQPLRLAAEAAIAALPGVLSATAMLTSHQQQPQKAQNAIHAPAPHIIAVASGKGGVGKSTTAINLALAFSKIGLKTGILDADIYGPSLPRLSGLKQKPTAENNKLIPLEAHGIKIMSIGFLLEEDAPTIWRGPMVMSAIEQMLKDVAWGGIDLLVIDMPPGTGDVQLTLSQRTKLTGAVIVSTPQDLALIDARKGLNMFKKTNVPVLGIIENMSYFSCPHCGEESHIFGHGGAEKEAEKLGVPFLGKIPLEMEIRANADLGTPIVSSAPTSRFAEIYCNIAKALSQNLTTAMPQAPKITIN